jgi:hypothetical protein
MQVPTDQAVQSLVTHISNVALPFFTAVAAVGVLSMAIIQTVKDLSSVRRWFQRRAVARWLGTKAAESGARLHAWALSEEGRAFMGREGSRKAVAPAFSGFSGRVAAGPAEADLVLLATDGDRAALYDLPVEQLCGQLNSASQVVLDRPARHQDLMFCLASRAEPLDLARLVFPPSEARAARPKSGQGQERFDAYVDARNRVAHQVQRALDALQLSVGFQWKFYLQLASILLSGVIAGLGVFFFSDVDSVLKRLGTTVVVATVGGFLAPVARDLVASLRQLRK